MFPALLEHESQQVPNFQLSRGKATVTAKGITVKLGSDLGSQRNTLRMLMRHQLIGTRCLRQNGRQLLLRPKISQHNAAILFIPVVFQRYQSHLHTALLNQTAQQAKLIQLAGKLCGKLNTIGTHLQRRRNTPDNVYSLIQTYIRRHISRHFIKFIDTDQVAHSTIDKTLRLLMAPEQFLLGPFCFCLKSHSNKHRKNILMLTELLP